MRTVERYITQARVLGSQKDWYLRDPGVSVMCAHLPGLFCGTSSMWDAALHQILYTAGTICLCTNTVHVSFPPLFHAASLSNSPYIRISKAPVRTPVGQTLQELSVKANLLLVLYGTCRIGIFHKEKSPWSLSAKGTVCPKWSSLFKG